MDTSLASLEKPQGLMMKLTDCFARRKLGKLLTLAKAHRCAGRLPSDILVRRRTFILNIKLSFPANVAEYFLDKDVRLGGSRIIRLI